MNRCNALKPLFCTCKYFRTETVAYQYFNCFFAIALCESLGKRSLPFSIKFTLYISSWNYVQQPENILLLSVPLFYRFRHDNKANTENRSPKKHPFSLIFCLVEFKSSRNLLRNHFQLKGITNKCEPIWNVSSAFISYKHITDVICTACNCIPLFFLPWFSSKIATGCD